MPFWIFNLYLSDMYLAMEVSEPYNDINKQV